MTAKPIDFTLGIHSHQPVGNFDHVLAEAMERCYEPFLTHLERYPAIRLSLHYSGCLLEWIEKHRPQFIDRLAACVGRGQVELMGGGFYEPILSSLREEDAVSQLLLMQEYLKRRFGVSARGMWLTERVWTPGIPRLAAQAGIEYTLVDDTHFRHTGLAENKMHGYYMTESGGDPLAVFPIDKTLRYAIPFAEPQKTIDHLRFLRDQCGASAVCYGDDGEKFGIWPETYNWVYEQGWLTRFFDTLQEHKDEIVLRTMSEIIDRKKANGRIYLPVASYDEMMEWSLIDSDATLQFHQLTEKLKERDEYERYRSFVRGGMWHNFMVKYPESDAMNKRALVLSKKIDRLNEKSPQHLRARKGINPGKALTHLWAAQCNCAYWHGLFGGLYLSHLRHAIYSQLIEAEKQIEQQQFPGKTDFLEIESIDTDLDGEAEILLSNRAIGLQIKPNYGGAITRIDYKPAAFSLTNVLARRTEAYHHLQAGGEDHPGSDSPKSIHSQRQAKVGNWRELLVHDPYLRYSFLDHLLPAETTLDTFKKGKASEDIAPAGSYQLSKQKKTAGKLQLSLKRDEMLHRDGKAYPLEISKQYEFDSKHARINFRVEIESASPQTPRFLYGMEWNFTLLAGHDDQRQYFFGPNQSEDLFLDSQGTIEKTKAFGVINRWDKFQVKIDIDNSCRLWRFPLETMSQSESGLEKTYQGSCLLALQEVTLKAGQPFVFSGSLAIEAIT